MEDASQWTARRCRRIKRGGRWRASLTVERADLPFIAEGGSVIDFVKVTPHCRLERHRDITSHMHSNPRLKKAESERKTERLQPPPRRSAGRPTISRIGRAQQDHRRLPIPTRTFEDLNVAGISPIQDAAFAQFRTDLTSSTAGIQARRPARTRDGQAAPVRARRACHRP